MAGNFGKFKDRSPIICAAGKPSGDSTVETVASTLKEYKLVDEIEAIKHDANIWKEDGFVLPKKLPPIQNKSFLGFNSRMRKIIQPPAKTRFQQLICDLKDTPYSSYWNAEVGRVRDPAPGLPAGMKPLEVTFGKPTKKEATVKELVSPPKGPYQVLRESQAGHEMYRKTHNDYNPSERIERRYCIPPYDPNKCYGRKSKYDPRGIWVKCACHWYNTEPLAHVSKLEADRVNKIRPQIGKVSSPNNNASCVPPSHSYGKPSRPDLYTVEDLLKDPNVKPCIFKKEFRKWLSSLNVLKAAMKRRCRDDGFNFNDFYKKAVYLDTDKTGSLPLGVFYDLCACNGVTFKKRDIESLLKVLHITRGDKICYKEFIDLIDFNKESLEMPPLDDIPKESKYYISTSQAAQCDYLIIDNSDMPPAGLPSIRFDLPFPGVPQGACRADLENLGNDTSAKAVLSPSIYTDFGLTYRDFFAPRDSNTIRQLFEKVGYTFPEDSFEKLWEIGMKQDGTGLVCVETFKNLLNMYCPPMKKCEE